MLYCEQTVLLIHIKLYSVKGAASNPLDSRFVTIDIFLWDSLFP